MSLPSVEDVRHRINRVQDEQVRYTLIAAYLFAARISEVVSRACPRDTTVARGPRGSEVKLDTCKIADREYEAAVFKVKTAKRQGRERLIALPLTEEYEPWARPLYSYFLRAENAPVFPLTRQKVFQYICDNYTFENFTYQIDEYKVKDKDTLAKKPIPMHNHVFRLHALRHLRANELVEFYGFNVWQLCGYGGWTTKGMLGGGGSFDRYVSVSWQSYFGKLLKKRTANAPATTSLALKLP